MKDLKIHFLNTIWSDAIVIECNNHYGLVDTGSSFYYPMVEEHLKKLNVINIDFIILTHFHTDHYGNLSKLINNFNVKKIYLKHYYGLDGTTSSGYQSNEEYIENEFKNYYEILNSAKLNNTSICFMDELDQDSLEIDFEGIKLDVFDIKNRLYNMYNDPKSEFYQQKRFNENFDSVGIFIKYGQYNIFLGGDVTCSQTDITNLKELSIKMINKIYSKYQIDKIHLYKSCHHGGGGTNTDKLCQLLQADYVVITNTNRWLDNYDTFKNLKDANPLVTILQTDYQKYIFTINETIRYETINEVSLFITLNKD
ncbi:MAG: MBL fold metallo-hydrolase [Bacilli bacterium]|nr:MBL fold metallo-hydrolase [Bacilli bacterium]